MDLTSTKILVAVLFGLLRFFFGLLPVKIYRILRHWEEEDSSHNFFNQKRHNQVNCALALCQSFGGGVLFATCFLHMMLEVYKSVEELKKIGNLNTEYPLSQLTICLGFFLVYFLEEISNWFITKLPTDGCPKKHNNLKHRIITPNLNNKVSPCKEKQQDKIFIINSDSANSNDKTISDINIKEKEELENKNENEDDDISLDSEVISENEKNESTVNEIEAKEIEKLMKSDVKNAQQIMRCIFLVLALSCHAIFEGLAIGLQNSIADIWYLFTAVSIHSATILFCIGFELVIVKTKVRIISIQMLILSVASPVGVLIGLLITLKSDMETKSMSTAVVLLEALSTGTILYITFFEVLNREKEKRIYRLYRSLMILAGFILMASLQALEIYH